MGTWDYGLSFGTYGALARQAWLVKTTLAGEAVRYFDIGLSLCENGAFHRRRRIMTERLANISNA